MAQRRGKRRKSDWYVICAETWDRTPQEVISNKRSEGNTFYIVSNNVLQVEPKQHIHPLSCLLTLFICKVVKHLAQPRNSRRCSPCIQWPDASHRTNVVLQEHVRWRCRQSQPCRLEWCTPDKHYCSGPYYMHFRSFQWRGLEITLSLLAIQIDRTLACTALECIVVLHVRRICIRCIYDTYHIPKT